MDVAESMLWLGFKACDIRDRLEDELNENIARRVRARVGEI